MNVVKVAWAPNAPGAEMLQAFLRDAGIESLVRRSGAGFEPDLLGSGPREILVAEEEANRAREVLGDQASTG
ncbi:MAG TPA: DUF2007 domain-containing protein [Solirubrobacteraceae bacterium]|nr:DUF2007 domain-containing protein [Solirubrobacteraceae bacterium]